MDAFRSALTQYRDFHAMLSDTVRMNAFERAIRQKVKPGDVVVDLGAGTGILGFLAIRAGADKVFAIEKSDAIDLARAVAAKNGMTDRIDFHTDPGEPRERKLLFKFKRKGAVHGVGGWFDLELTEDIHLSTAPGNPATHWKQAFFPILDRIRVIEGDLMELTMSVSPQSEASDNTVISYQYRCSQLVKENQGSGEIGRNDPCPCGSGLKYKKCCGR